MKVGQELRVTVVT